MENRYKLILSNNNFYREISIPAEAVQYRVGTALECDYRLAKERFFTEFELWLTKDKETWSVHCRNQNIYIQSEGSMKLRSCELSHGSELQIMYRFENTDQKLFNLSFMLDFEASNSDYSRVIDISGCLDINLGRNQSCDIVLDDPLLEHDIFTLSNENNEWVIHDRGSRYGVYVNGQKIRGKETIHDYDFFSILEFSFYYKNGELYTSSLTKLFPGSLPTRTETDQQNRLSYPKFNRSTQIHNNVPDEAINVMDPPAKPQENKQNIIMTLLPSVAMIALTVVMRGIMGGGNLTFVLYSAISMGIGVIMSVVGHINGQKDFKENSRKREEEYNSYIEQKRSEVRHARQDEKRILEQKYISPEREEEIVAAFNGELFDRAPEDEDFLKLRVGTGSVEAIRKITYKPRESITVEDPMTEYPQKLYEEFKNIDDVPITLNLAQSNAIGVVGGDEIMYEFAKQSLVDLCTRQYFDECSLFLISEQSLEEFEWARWFPHFTNESLNLRNIADTAETSTVLMEYLYTELLKRSKEKVRQPHLIIISYCCASMKNHPISKFIKNASALGATFIFMENYREFIPQYCSEILTLDSKYCMGTILYSDGSHAPQDFAFRSLSDESAAAIALKLAPVYCEEISLESALTKSISFFDMMGIFTVDDLDLQKRWSTARIDKTMAAPIGVRSHNELVYLDLHEKAHGPHGLVAGTTGSGKSETLLSYILSMAIAYHPYEVGFVIIDFKGGGMVDRLENLPHLIGAITNLDGREIDRSLKSIQAELNKRMRVFRESGCDNINSYIKLFKAGEVKLPLPHLIIVVDEFSELKQDQPEFMNELVSAARIGRSLGVHLILATQKPAGQVSDQIWSNSRFHLCLKVQTPEDSNEMLKSPLAAEIRETGRGYLQVGNNEIFELFQSAYSGGPAVASDVGNQKEFSISKVSTNGKREVVFTQKKQKAESDSGISQLDAIADYINAYCKRENIEHLPAICLPPLPALIPYPDTPFEKKADYRVRLGIYDDPDNQYQGIADITVGDSNLLILGSSQTGKTNMLQVIIRQLAEQYSPRELAMYIMDFGAMSLRNYAKLNHVGGVVTASEDEKLKNLFKLLLEEIELRKQILADSGLSSFSAYLEAEYDDLPLILVFLDNFSVFKELYAENYEDTLLYLIREGQTYGISVVITNVQASGLSYRYLSNINTRIAFTCNDRNEYLSIFDRCRMEPKNTAGRALFAKDKMYYEFQSYLAFGGEREIDRVEEIRSFIEKTNEMYVGQTVKQIPSIPELVSIGYIRKNYPAVSIKENISVALDYGTIDCVSMNCYEQLILAIAGKNAEKRMNFLKMLMTDIKTNYFVRPVQMYILDNFKRELGEYKDLPYVQSYSASADVITEYIDDVANELEDRYSVLEDEGQEALDEMPWIIVMVNNKQALDVMAGSRDHENTFTNICKKYTNLKTLFLLTEVNDAAINSSAGQMLRKVKEDKKLLYFGAVKEMKILDVYASATKGVGGLASNDDAYWFNGENILRVKTIQEVQ